MSLAIHRIAGIQRTYRHAHRYAEILATMFRYGFGDVVERLNVERYVLVAMPTSWRAEWERRRELPLPVRLRMAMEELGPAFVKFGQILSTHPEVVPEDWIPELRRLQESVRPFPFAEADAILAEELGAEWRSLFARFDEEPLAAASIGQVHRAALADGRELVVKVQRPNIRRIVEVDLEIMAHLAGLMEREGFATWRPVEMVEEFARAVARETDYTVESGQQERFARMFEGDPTVRTPRIVHELLTPRVLAMEFIEGTRPTSAAALAEKGHDPRVVAARGFDQLLRQVFIHGFFHADPHPGNLRVMEGDAICYLDFGMMGRMNRDERESFADLVAAIAVRDARACTRAFMRLADYDSVPDRDAVERSVDEMMTQHLQESLKDLDLGSLLQGIIDVVGKFRMSIPPDLLLMIKALSTIEGIGRSLDPDFNPISQAEPFLREYILRRRHPDRIAREAFERMKDLAHFLEEIPDQLRETTRMLRRGELSFNAEHRGLEPMYRTFDRASRRLSLAVLVGAMLVSSSVMVLADVRQVGVLGFVVAGVLCAFLIVSLMRQGWK